MPKVEEVQAAAAKRASPDVEAPARPVAQNQNSGEKEKTRVLALLSHVNNLPCSVASDAKQLETSHGLGTGVSRRVAPSRWSDRSDRGGNMERARKMAR